MTQQVADDLRAAKHTPTPWSIHPEDGSYIVKLPYSRVGGIGIASTEMGNEWNEWDQCEANAEFIVRAVNSHDALIAAGQALYDAIGNVERGEHPLMNAAVLKAGHAWTAAILAESAT